MAHQEMVKALSGRRSGSVGVSQRAGDHRPAPFINVVKQALVARGFTIVNSLPALHPTLTLFSARQLTRRRPSTG